MKKSGRLPLNKAATHATASIICLTLILGGFQNCSPMESAIVTLESKELEIPIEDLAAPSAMINTPMNNSTVMGNVAITVLATDDTGVAGVQLYIDGVPYGTEDTTAPFDLSWNTSGLTNRTYILTARARDASGKINDSPEVSVSVNNTAPPADTQAPMVSMTSPSDNSTVTAGSVILSANASDNVGVAGVQFYIDGAAIGSEDLSSPYSISVNVSMLANGNRSITARARDGAGNMTTSSAVTLMVNKPTTDTQAPSVSVTGPQANAQVSGTINLTANASDSVGVVGVRFTVDNATVGAEDTSAPYSVSLNTTSLSNGTHTVRAIARDAAGNSAVSNAVTITVNNVAENPNATYTWIAANVLNRCTACHGAGGASAGVRYNSYTETMKTVRAGSPSGSDFYKEINSGSMPEGGSKLSATQIKAVSDWITKGAPND